MRRRFGWLLGLVSLALFVGTAGCNGEIDLAKVKQQVKEQAKKHLAGDHTTPVSTKELPPARGGETIRVATFNIQVFGVSKMKKPNVTEALTRIVRRFDIVAIQEVRSKENILPEFVSMLNSDGSHYDYVIGPRQGRTSSKEQYVLVFDTERIEFVPGSLYVVQDPGDRMHREPLVGQFKVRGGANPFTFTLINIHTDPDETAIELDALDDVFRSVQRNATGEDDIILLGDLNVDEEKLGQLGRVQGITWVVKKDQMTNTRGNKSYDNILFQRGATVEFTGYAGVFNFKEEFGLSKTEALRISDHLPVWAEFSSVEGQAGTTVAARDGKPAR